jgi:hypothetical protein
LEDADYAFLKSTVEHFPFAFSRKDLLAILEAVMTPVTPAPATV